MKHVFYSGRMNASTNTFAHKVLKAVLYLVGAFYGFVGYSVLWFSQFMFRPDDQELSLISRTMAISSVLFGIYLLYVAYLILWRFSNASLKHACIVSAFCIWTFIAPKPSLQPSNELLVWGSLIGVIVACIFAYHSLNRVLIHGMR
jgi:hypothetical protein